MIFKGFKGETHNICEFLRYQRELFFKFAPIFSSLFNFRDSGRQRYYPSLLLRTFQYFRSLLLETIY